jgi:hypothetical protein
LGFFKSKKDVDVGDPIPSKTKKIKDRQIKPASPKRTIYKKIVRIGFWSILCFCSLSGFVTFAQGPKIIYQTTTIGSTKIPIDDSVKGFAIDFATEYFTWNWNNVTERQKRLSMFIQGIDADAGLKPLEIKGSSRVLEVSIYDTKNIDQTHVDVTVLVRREVTVEKQESQNTSKDGNPTISQKKNYMTIPVTITGQGFVIQKHPRFVTENQRGESIKEEMGTTITEEGLMVLAKDLSENLFRSWYDGNINQLKYFYYDKGTPPKYLGKSNLSLVSIDRINIFSKSNSSSPESPLTMNVQLTVKTDIGEQFSNNWEVTIFEREGRLYVINVGPSVEIKSDGVVPVVSTNTK